MLVGLVADDHAVTEVDQLEHGRHHTAGAPQGERVELQLEQRLALETDPGRPARLVVDHSDRAVGCDVDAVDEPAQEQLGLEQRLDVELALRGLEPPRVLEREVAVDRDAAADQPLVEWWHALGVEHLRRRRLGLDQRLPRRHDQVVGALRGALGGGQVEQVLEHLVHHRAAHCIDREGLGQLVDGAESVEQRAAHEVAGPARRDGAEHVDAVDQGRVRLRRRLGLLDGLDRLDSGLHDRVDRIDPLHTHHLPPLPNTRGGHRHWLD